MNLINHLKKVQLIIVILVVLMIKIILVAIFMMTYRNKLPSEFIAFSLIDNIFICLFYYYSMPEKTIHNNTKDSQSKKSILIGITGDSGVGKSKMMESVKLLFGKNRVLCIDGDSDHKWERNHEKWNEITHLNPKANYLHKQVECLKSLKVGNSVEKVEYDHFSGKFTKPKKIFTNDFIVISGLHSFYLPKMRKLIDLKIYVDTDEKLRKHWKIIRDCRERGYSKEKILEQIESRKNDSAQYILPQKRFADLIFKIYPNNDFEIGNDKSEFDLLLKVTLNANIDLEKILEMINSEEANIYHDYENNLKTQYIILARPVSIEIIQKIVKSIYNSSKFIDTNQIIWQDGYNAFIQLIILLVICESIKGGELI